MDEESTNEDCERRGDFCSELDEVLCDERVHGRGAGVRLVKAERQRRPNYIL